MCERVPSVAFGPPVRRSVKAAPRILVPMVQVRILAAEQPLRGGAGPETTLERRRAWSP